MSQTRETPHWFTRGNVAATVRAARVDDVSNDRVVDVLAEHEFDAGVELVRELVTDLDVTPPTTADTAAVDPDTRRDAPTRRFTVSDIEYLDRREFARVLGGTLTRYGGTFQLADPDGELVVDLFWRRQHTTAAFRVEPRVGDDTVGAKPVRTAIEGDTDPLVGRAASRVLVVTNRSFTEAAVDAADTDVELVGPATLRWWFGDARLSRAVAGDLVDAAGLTDEQFGDLLEGVDRVPSVRRPDDPFSVVESVATESGDAGSGGTESNSGSTSEPEPNPGPDPTPGSEPEPEPDSAPIADPDGWSAELDPIDGAVEETPARAGVLYDEGDELEPEPGDADAVDEFVDGLGGEES